LFAAGMPAAAAEVTPAGPAAHVIVALNGGSPAAVEGLVTRAGGRVERPRTRRGT
jgi:hypothetical protein